MRVLWFSPTSSNYPTPAGTPRCGGWVSALETELAKRDDVDLGIAFLHPDDCFKKEVGRTAYYPLRRGMSIADKVDRFFRISAQDDVVVKLALRVISDFRPDIIHVFGTENAFGLLRRYTEIPLVVHLQGLMNPYLNAWVPPFYSIWDYFRSTGMNPLFICERVRAWKYNRHSAERETDILAHVDYVMGRTAWDRAFSRLYAPNARYFHCDEMIRPLFLAPTKRTPPERLTLVTTISGPLYKGHDLILKTAALLVRSGHTDFEWNVFGVRNLSFAEKKTGIRSSDVHVRCFGSVGAECLRDEILKCSAYVHPSYIDNSPNSVCEAQLLGVPVIACDVGGLSTLIETGKTGILVPANDPVSLADAILSCPTMDGSEIARVRHNPETIVSTLLSIYEEIRILSSSPKKTNHENLYL